jgi:hypothetical protein
MSDSPVRVLSDHPTAVVRRELRLAIREPEFDPEAARRVVELLARGIGLSTIGDLSGFPAYGVVNFWRARYPEFDEACVLASEAGADALAWENVTIADDDTRSPANKALSIQVRERLSKVLNRKKYDPAVKVEVTGNARAADELSDAELATIARRSAVRDAVDAVIVPASDGDGDGSGS